MRTLFTFLCAAGLAPVILCAQPTVTRNEFYSIGDVIQMVNCDASTVSAGGSGESVMWDFSAITHNAGFSTTTVLHNTSSVFLTSDLLLLLPDGTREHMQENSTDSYVNSIEDTLTHVTTYYNKYDVARRPFTYGTTTAIDTYKVTVPATGRFGTGYLTITADAFGTLKLPTGTFNNVLRIKKMQVEADTTGGDVVNTTTVSYLWFDTVHTAPLFRIDSVIGVIGSKQTAMYLALPTEVQPVVASGKCYSGYLGSNDLQLWGSFEQGKTYDVVVHNITGQRVLGYEFAATADHQQFAMDRMLSAGMYVVTIVPQDAPGDRTTIKVMRQ